MATKTNKTSVTTLFLLLFSVLAAALFLFPKSVSSLTATSLSKRARMGNAFRRSIKEPIRQILSNDNNNNSNNNQSSKTTTTTTTPTITKKQVQDLFHLWNDALGAENPDAVARRYSPTGAVLLPTVSDIPRTDYDSIRNYFEHFLQSQPTGRILQSHVTIGTGWCSDVGLYEFTMGTTGNKVRGRYSFVYVWENGQWLINHHHSSKMPESS